MSLVASSDNWLSLELNQRTLLFFMLYVTTSWLLFLLISFNPFFSWQSFHCLLSFSFPPPPPRLLSLMLYSLLCHKVEVRRWRFICYSTKRYVNPPSELQFNISSRKMPVLTMVGCSLKENKSGASSHRLDPFATKTFHARGLSMNISARSQGSLWINAQNLKD